jgi:hypothetical protein
VYLDAIALAEANISTNMTVQVPQAKAIKTKSALNLILDKHGLTYVVKNEILNITSKKRARGEKIVKVYYVEDLRGTNVMDMIVEIIDPESWVDGDSVIVMHGVTQSLAIRQFEDVHARIEELLNQIRKAKEENEKSESHSTVLPFGCCLLYHKSRNRVERNDERSLSCEIPIAPNFWEWTVTNMPKPWKMDVRPEPGQAVGFALAQTPSVVGLDESSSGISNRLQYIEPKLPTEFMFSISFMR